MWDDMSLFILSSANQQSPSEPFSPEGNFD
jgi:hypothetical protein